MRWVQERGEYRRGERMGAEGAGKRVRRGGQGAGKSMEDW